MGRMMLQLQDAFSKKSRPNGLDPSKLSYDFIKIIHQIDADMGMTCDDDDWIQIF